MASTIPPPSASDPDLAARTFEETLTDLESLTDELVVSAGPDAVAGVGGHTTTGGVAVSRLAAAALRLRALGTRLDTLRLTWHGLAKRANRKDAYPAAIEFLAEILGR